MRNCHEHRYYLFDYEEWPNSTEERKLVAATIPSPHEEPIS